MKKGVILKRYVFTFRRFKKLCVYNYDPICGHKANLKECSEERCPALRTYEIIKAHGNLGHNRKHTQITKDKISRGNKGKKQTPETKQLISKKHRGKQKTFMSKKGIRQIYKKGK